MTLDEKDDIIINTEFFQYKLNKDTIKIFNEVMNEQNKCDIIGCDKKVYVRKEPYMRKCKEHFEIFKMEELEEVRRMLGEEEIK